MRDRHITELGSSFSGGNRVDFVLDGREMSPIETRVMRVMPAEARLEVIENLFNIGWVRGNGEGGQ